MRKQCVPGASPFFARAGDEASEHQAGKIERLYVCLVQQKTLQALQSSAITKIPNIPQCTLPSQPMCQTLLSDFSRVWLRD